MTDLIWSFVSHTAPFQAKTFQVEDVETPCTGIPARHSCLCLILKLPVPQADLSLSETRRIALAAQGFGKPRPAHVTARRLGAVIRQLGLLQLDFVNVLVPAHYLVIYSRLGDYPRSLLDEVVYRSGHFTEQWAHEASIVPVETWPLLRHRMATHRVRPWGFEKFIEQQAEYVAWVLEQVRERGPLLPDELPPPEGHDRRITGDAWVGTIPRAVLEAHFGRGILGIADRGPGFARVYDLAERLIPPEHHSRGIEREDAQRELIRQAARAYGIATVADLGDYFRMNIRDARARVAELVESGELRPVTVEGWREPAYLHPAASLPRRMDACALLSPFDPLVWFRPRAERLFGFEYRLEIYVPAKKRRWGYYVLPFLQGERLVARVDLKADRVASRLLVQSVHYEPDAKLRQARNALNSELRALATWLGLKTVHPKT